MYFLHCMKLCLFKMKRCLYKMKRCLFKMKRCLNSVAKAVCILYIYTVYTLVEITMDAHILIVKIFGKTLIYKIYHFKSI